MAFKKKTVSIENLIDEIAHCTIAQSRAVLQEKNARKGNRYADRVTAAFNRLCQEFGDTGRERLKILFEHEHSQVRVAAAAFLLRYATEEAVKVLTNVAKNERTFAAFEASEALKRWDEGTWRLDPASNESE